MTYRKRPLEALINRSEPAWPLVQSWIAEATNHVEVLRAAPDAGSKLVMMQVTTRSPLGAVIFETGGILVDYGWIRLLGSGHRRLPRSLPDWNYECGIEESDTSPPLVLIADDAIGGFFALNGGRLPAKGNTVWYFAPDTLEWEDTEKGYEDFLYWSFVGDLEKFYSPYRWPGWQQDVARLRGDETFSIVPFLWTEGPDISQRTRRPVPTREIFELHVGAV